MPVDGKGPKGNDVLSKTHATGSGISYGMRYLLIMAFNLTVLKTKEDDDGNAASGYGTISDKQVAHIRAKLKEYGNTEAAVTYVVKVERRLPDRHSNLLRRASFTPAHTASRLREGP